MRVLLVSQEYPPESARGGIGTYAGTLAPALARLGAEVHVVAIGAVAERSSHMHAGVRVHRAPLRWPRAAGRLSRLPEACHRVGLARAVRDEHRRLGIRFDVCEAPDWGAEAALLDRRRPTPLVVRLHSGSAQLYPFTGRAGLDTRLAVRVERLAIARADLLTGTPWQLAYARDALGVPAPRLHELTYPLRAADPLPQAAGSDVLFLGRLEQRKGPDVLVRALPALLERVPEARLTLAGVDTGPRGARSCRARLEQLAEATGVRAHVAFDERWGPDVVAEHLRRSAVVAVPSRWESFGYTAAEAMAAGRPVAASAIPAFRDLVRNGETGVIVASGDARAWAEALAGLILDRERARALGAAARAAVLARHAPERVAAATLEAYEKARATHRV